MRLTASNKSTEKKKPAHVLADVLDCGAITFWIHVYFNFLRDHPNCDVTYHIGQNIGEEEVDRERISSIKLKQEYLIRKITHYKTERIGKKSHKQNKIHIPYIQ